ncbi:hypothetical protein [Marinobacter sp. KMM 10035]|uniref:hypothetical protein n=1 Tax=Marinobacter sp. KMM 10035 TaxID=3134034 RepID=UPI00397DCC04
MTLAPAVDVSLLAYLWPLFIVLMTLFLPSESLRKQHLLGVVLALTGCWLLIGGNSSGFALRNLDGYLVAFSCALIWSAFVNPAHRSLSSMTRKCLMESRCSP